MRASMPQPQQFSCRCRSSEELGAVFKKNGTSTIFAMYSNRKTALAGARYRSLNELRGIATLIIVFYPYLLPAKFRGWSVLPRLLSQWRKKPQTTGSRRYESQNMKSFAFVILEGLQSFLSPAYKPIHSVDRAWLRARRAYEHTHARF